MQTDLILQRPPTSDNAELLLLFHGVGSSPEDLAPLAQALGSQRPNAWVISVRSPDRSDLGRGWQWFSVHGVTEANRPERIASAMPAFLERVRAWQSETGVSPLNTTLVGFSQGAIMALESTQLSGSSTHTARVVAIAGRFAQPPRHKPENIAVHLLHGEQDHVMPVRLAMEAERELRSLGASPTLDCFTGLGHGIDARVVQAIGRRLQALNQEKDS